MKKGDIMKIYFIKYKVILIEWKYIFISYELLFLQHFSNHSWLHFPLFLWQLCTVMKAKIIFSYNFRVPLSLKPQDGICM